MPEQRLVTTTEFVEITQMDITQFYVLFCTGKLPIVRRGRGTCYVDINDIRAKCWLPDYKPERDLFG